MAIEVFNRHEIKYMVSRDALGSIMARLDEYMVLDKNCKGAPYSISNIYYDTDDNYFIRHSLSKPKYKEKVRLRSYGIPMDDDLVYLEVKKKVKGLVNKRRTQITLSDANDFIKTKKKPQLKSYMNGQVLNEIEYILSNFNLIPKLYLAYDRIAYFANDGQDLRVTFDTNIRSRRYDLNLSSGDYGDLILSEDFVLMEVKARYSFPLKMTKTLSEHRLYKASFSKYGTEYLQMLQNFSVRQLEKAN